MKLIKKVLPQICFAALFLLGLTLDVYGVTGGSTNAASYDCAGGFVCCDGPNCDFEAFKYNVMHIIREVLKYAFVFIALMFAYAGFKYMTASGDTGQISEAHDMFKKVAIGTIIVLLSFLIIEAITSALGLNTGIINLIK